MATALDNEIKTKHQVLKPFSYGKGQTASKGDVLDTSKWSGLAAGRMVRNGFILEVPLSTDIKESDPYEEPKKEKPKVEAKAAEDEPKAAKTVTSKKKKGSSKKKKGA